MASTTVRPLELKQEILPRPLDRWPPVSVELLGTQTRLVRGRRFTHRVIEAGSRGEPLILIHGIGGHAETYARNMHNLAAHGFHVFAIDALFHGFSDKEPWDGRDTMGERQAEALADLIPALGYSYAHIEGESMGGMITFEFGMRHPELCGKLVMNTGFGRVALGKTDFVAQPGGGQTLQKLSQESVASPTFDSMRKRMEWLVASPERMTDEMVQIRLRLYQFPDIYASMQRVYAIGQDWTRTPTYTEEDCARLTAESLVFWTERNPGQGPDYGEYCASLLPNARFYNMLDAAHWPQWEKPEEHDQVLIDFILG